MLIGVIAEETLLPLVVAPGLVLDGGPFAQWIGPDTFYQANSTIIGFVIPGLVDETDLVFGAENFFRTYITQDYFGIWPNLYDDIVPETFYAFSTGFQPILQPPPGIDIDFIPPATIPAIPPIAPGRYIDQDVFYGPQFYGGTLPGLFVDGDVVRAAIIRRDGDPLVLLADVFNDVDLFFAPSLARAVLPGLVIDSDIIYAAAQANPPLAPRLFGSDDAFFAAFIANVLLPSRVFDTETIIGPELRRPGNMELFVDNDIFPVASVQFGALAPLLLVDSDTFLMPVIASTPALYPLDPIIDFRDQFYAPAMSQNLGLAPALWVDVDDIKSIPYIIMGQGAIPPLFDDSANDAVFAVTVSAVDGAAPALFVDTDTFYVPTETSAHFLPPLLSDDALVEALYTPLVYPTLTPSAIADSDVFYAPVCGAAGAARVLAASRAGLGSVIAATVPNKTQIVSNIGAVT